MKLALSGVRPWRHDLAGCLHATVASVLAQRGHDPLDVLGAGWRFCYQPGNFRREEYYFPCRPGTSLLENLAPYHPVTSAWHTPASAEEGWSQVKGELLAGRPVNHLAVVYGFDDEAGTVRILDAVPPAFDGDIGQDELAAARDSGNVAVHDRDMFFADQLIGNRWLGVETGGDGWPQPGPEHLATVLRGNLAAFADGGLESMAGFLGGIEDRLAAGHEVADELFVGAGTTLASTALHADWLAAAAARLRRRRLAELGRRVERLAYHWTAVRILAALTRDGEVTVARLARRHRALLAAYREVLDELEEQS
jgi:Butirosin biosynthesis protein H, N-terminal